MVVDPEVVRGAPVDGGHQLVDVRRLSGLQVAQLVQGGLNVEDSQGDARFLRREFLHRDRFGGGGCRGERADEQCGGQQAGEVSAATVERPWMHSSSWPLAARGASRRWVGPPGARG